MTARYAPLVTPCYAPDDFQPACVVTTDIADYGLLPDNALPYRDRLDVVLDHHRSNAMSAPVRVVRETAGACAELILDVMDAMGVSLTADIAECIYIALSTDTGGFRYSNTVPDTLRAAARCLEAGVDGGEINRRLFEVKTWPRCVRAAQACPARPMPRGSRSWRPPARYMRKASWPNERGAADAKRYLSL